MISQITKRWIKNAADERAVSRGYYFDEAVAQRVALFFKRFLRHSKGKHADQPFILADWQYNDVIAPAYGWMRPNGLRRFAKVYCEVPKKNGKSTLCAGVALYALVGDGESGPEVYSAAKDRSQAAIVFDEAMRMAMASPTLAKRLDPVTSSKILHYRGQNGFYKALSADVPTKEGLNASCIIFDELHVQENPKLYGTLRYAGAAREQRQWWEITTAGWDRTSICWGEHVYAQDVVSGRVDDDHFLGYIAGASEDDDWTDPAVWHKANPSLGTTISLSSFTDDFHEAEARPILQNEFKRYRLNIWTQQETRWLDMEAWSGYPHENVPNACAKRVCYSGLDLSSTTDIAAYVLWFPEERQVLPFFFVPSENVRVREKQGRVRIDQWVASRHIITTEGNAVDQSFIREFVKASSETFDLKGVAIDRWNSTQMQTWLQGDGIDVVQWGQGFASMNAGAKELERLVVTRSLLHGCNPVLHWMAGNTAAEIDAAGNIKPSKKKSTEKIDGIVALVMAIGMAMKAAEEQGGRIIAG